MPRRQFHFSFVATEATLREALALLARVAGCQPAAAAIGALDATNLARFDALPLLQAVASALPPSGSLLRSGVPSGGEPTTASAAGAAPFAPTVGIGCHGTCVAEEPIAIELID